MTTRFQVQAFIEDLYRDPAFKKPARLHDEEGFTTESLAGAVLEVAHRHGITLWDEE